MRLVLKTFFAVAMVFFACTGFAVADEKLFDLIAAKGGEPISITESFLAKLPPKEFDAIPPNDEKSRRHFGGVLMRDILKAAGATGTKVMVKALDGYEMEIPLSDFEEFDVIAATAVDGNRLTVRELGPAWIMYPNIDNPDLTSQLYASRCVWQIKEIRVE
jgi:hypothetical protein